MTLPSWEILNNHSNILGAYRMPAGSVGWVPGTRFIPPMPPCDSSPWVVFPRPFLSPAAHIHLPRVLMHSVGKLTQLGDLSKVTQLLWGRRRTRTQICRKPKCLPSGTFPPRHSYGLAVFLVPSFMLSRLGEGLRRRQLLLLQPHLWAFRISGISGCLESLDPPPFLRQFYLGPLSLMIKLFFFLVEE